MVPDEVQPTIRSWVQNPIDAIQVLLHRFVNLSSMMPFKVQGSGSGTDIETIWKFMALYERGLVQLITDPQLDLYLKMNAIYYVYESRWKRTWSQGISGSAAIRSEPVPMSQLENVAKAWIPATVPEPLVTEISIKYRLIVPKDQTKLLAIRYLLGLADAYAHADAQDFAQLVEYIARKRTEITLPSDWPIPVSVKNDKNDPVWFLFGALMHLWPKKPWLLNKFKLFSWNYKSKVTKSDRVGLVIGVHKEYCMFWNTQEDLQLPFSHVELEWVENFVRHCQNFYDKLTATAPSSSSDIHIPVIVPSPKIERDQDNHRERKRNEQFFFDFVPRSSTTMGTSTIHTGFGKPMPMRTAAPVITTDESMFTEEEKEVLKPIEIASSKK